MRGRLAVSFVVLTLVLVLGLLLLRFYTVGGLLRAHEADQLRREAALTALVIEQRALLGEPIDEVFLSRFVGPDERIEYDDAAGNDVTVEGENYAEGDEGEDIEAAAPVGNGTLTLRESSNVVSQVILSDVRSVLLLLA